MTETVNTQRDQRVAIRLAAFCSHGRVEGAGALANISYSGALIDDTSMRPEIGAQVILYVYLKPPSAFGGATPFELVGHIVRHTDTGFAIEYKDSLDSDVRRMVDDAAAVVGVPR